MYCVNIHCTCTCTCTVNICIYCTCTCIFRGTVFDRMNAYSRQAIKTFWKNEGDVGLKIRKRKETRFCFHDDTTTQHYIIPTLMQYDNRKLMSHQCRNNVKKKEGNKILFPRGHYNTTLHYSYIDAVWQ